MKTVSEYGFLPEYMPTGARGIPARVTAVHKERYALVCDCGDIYGRLKTKDYYKGNERFPTVGDFVRIQYNECGDSQILGTLPRKTFFSRLDPSPGRGEQAVAANFDYVFILQSLNHDLNQKRLERYVTLAWQSGARPVVLLTKSDLVEDAATQAKCVEGAIPGVGVYAISATTGAGLDALADFLCPGKTIVFLGSSGVGKSSLVNALAGEPLMAVNEIRESDSHGRHTTTHRQLIRLKSGVMIIDTPGMRELGMWDVSAGIGEAFADVEQFLGGCKFSDCRHQSEPGCAIKAAIACGELSQERWERYQSLRREAKFNRAKTSPFGKKPRAQEDTPPAKADKKPDYRQQACTETFQCKVCGSFVAPQGAGSEHRNHCPNCLASVHVDNRPGDRASLCGGVMDAIGVWVRKNDEWAIIHRCRSCGKLGSNRVAADDNAALLLSIAVKPLACPPFPLDRLETMLTGDEAYK